jgi:hypothetical protein
VLLPLLVVGAAGLWLARAHLTPAQAAAPPGKDGAAPTRYVPEARTLRQAYARADGLFRSTRGRLFKASLTAHWFAGNTRFWYRNDTRGGTRDFVLVDAEKGTRRPAFDHRKLADALSKAAGKAFAPDRLPFDALEFVAEGKAVRFRIEDVTWECDLATYACTRVAKPPAAKKRSEPVSVLQPRGRRGGRGGPVRSPDGKWQALVKDHNVFIRAADGKETQLSRDGKEGNAYGLLSWSPDSKVLAAFRIEPGERKEVYLIQSSPPGGGRARLRSRPYDLPGDRFTAYELNLFDVAGNKQIKAEVERIDLGFGVPRLRWKPDGRHFTCVKVDRGHQRLRLIEVDAQTGKARNLIDETTKTFIWTAHGPGVFSRRLAQADEGTLLYYLDRTDEVLYASERGGWRHLYLIDTKTGKVKNQLTKGPWMVRTVERVDEERRQVWFRASGRNKDQDPYLVHYYRVNFDGSDLVPQTEGNGTHFVRYSPDGKYLIDTYSRVDQPPVHELRRASDGKLVCELERADVSALRETGWRPPEVFHARGRDGKTDIWGIVCRPRDFDPTKKYPVIENIYAGPHSSHVPKGFFPTLRMQALTELGFIVVQIDGMGTANRSKAFHDVCWHNLADAGFPDRILWIKALARKYPHVDDTRVGIYGTSAGGQNAAGAVLFHPDFYRAAVASCGCHDNRMDKASWNEQWMGYPVGPHYAASSNITHAGRLRGKLLLIVGELDTNVPPESTLRFADALIKAGKEFELLVVPGLGHSGGGRYGERRRRDFFVRHLHGVEPPDWNAGR